MIEYKVPEDLEPCPFCLTNPKAENGVTLVLCINKDVDACAWVVCDHCGASGPMYTDKDPVSACDQAQATWDLVGMYNRQGREA
jgi:hypothetical protein